MKLKIDALRPYTNFECSKQVKQNTLFYREFQEITRRDHTDLVKNALTTIHEEILAGRTISAPIGTKVNFNKDDYNYTCTFHYPVKLANIFGQVELYETNFDNTILNFRIPEVTHRYFTLESTDYKHTDKTEKFIDYTLKYGRQKFKYNDLVICQSTRVEDLSDNEYNNPQLQEKCETYLDNGRIYFTYNKQQVKSSACDHDNDYLYVMDENGKLYLAPDADETIVEAGHFTHAFILKGKLNETTFGYPRAASSAGTMKINAEGLITEITNSSGHYWPAEDQLKLSAYSLYKNKVLAENVKIDATISEGGIFSLSDIINLNIEEILARYNEMPNFEEVLPINADIQVSIDVSAIGVEQNIMEAIY